MNRLHVRTVDPVFVETHVDSGKAILRIGEARRGETRTAILEPGELRRLAIDLLVAAEEIDAKGTSR
jgi:hypothetical protein